ncbi:MAG: transporter [Luteolibacter sp.]
MKTLSHTTALALIASISQLHAGQTTSDSDYLATFEHLHFSERGTPIIHSFGIEPAFTGRDLFLDHSYRSGDGVTEHESEIELEWAFTKRLGIIVELPYIVEDEEGASTASGFGDIAIVPRALLIDSDQFMLTAQIETVLPTGSSTFGGDTAIAPGIAMWNDLGNWFTLNSQVGVEHVFDEDSTEFFFGIGFVKSFGEKPDLHIGHDHAHDHSEHSAAGIFNLHLEVTGATPINGDDQGDFEVEGLVGISYGLSSQTDLRLGYLFPISSPTEFDHGFTAGIIRHF